MSRDALENIAGSPVDFRAALRLFTASQHAALDETLSALDLSRRDHRDAFCGIQLRGFTRLGRACGWQAAEGTDALGSMTMALAAEAGPVDETSLPSDDPISPDAVAYVTLGSQMGLAVLRRALPPSEQTGLFGLEPDRSAWRAFRERMQDAPPSGAHASAVLSDAARAFDIFRAEARLRLPMKVNASR